MICFRYNPGPLRKGNPIIGEPEEAKYGLTNSQIQEAYREAQKRGAKRFGLHTMVVSNTLEEEALIENGKMLCDLGAKIARELGIKFDFFNLGGGVGTPYKPEQMPVDIERVAKGIQEAYRMAGFGETQSPRIVMECGRAITGPHGFLATEVLHVRRKYKNFVGVDATMANLMRPGMYGAYHHLTVLGKEDQNKSVIYDVTGSLCENNDKFAVNRALPSIERGDTIVIHNGGAHGHAMGFNYNAKLRCAEFLVDANGEIKKIRRAETMQDYFDTIVRP
jgi:diaminopimelate decarboxylase